MGFPAVVAREGPALWTRSAAVRERDAAYATATIELFSRLWHELEKLDNAARSPGAPTRIETRLLALRLELHLLAETCESSRWRVMLASTQREELKSVVERVLRAVAAAPLQQSVLAQAQNILFDAVLDLCGRLPQRGKASADNGV
jgi:hypothetical protein